MASSDAINIPIVSENPSSCIVALLYILILCSLLFSFWDSDPASMSGLLAEVNDAFFGHELAPLSGCVIFPEDVDPRLPGCELLFILDDGFFTVEILDNSFIAIS